ncbi:MAG: helix-hairpin-helix domain-containing protein [bacterium]
MGALALAVVAALGQGRLARPGPTSAACAGQPVGWRQDGVTTLHCGVGELAGLLLRCPPRAPVRAGVVVEAVVEGGRCHSRVDALPAAQRLALGVPLDANGATVDELRAVSGLGPALAARVVAGRPYARLADLERVQGLGPVRRARLAPHLSLGPPPPLWPAGSPLDASTPRRP